MAKKGRDILKSYFKRGNMPKEDHFIDLIDSMVNKVDDLPPQPQPPLPPVPPVPPLPPSPPPPAEIRLQVPADGKWHSLTDWSDSCRCYSLMAGCASRKNDRFALIHAVAMHCLGCTRRIEYTRSWFFFFPSRLRLRWHPKGDSWALQIRTCRNYGKESVIGVKLTELWGENDMDWILQKK